MHLEEAAKPQNRATTWYVTGDTGNKYTIHHKRNLKSHRKIWTCDCPDFTERKAFSGQPCKHIEFVQASWPSLSLQSIVPSTVPATAPTTAPKTAKEVLAIVTNFLNTRTYTECSDLWDVLTAFRGPDNGNDLLKRETTSKLRFAAGLTEKGSARDFAVILSGEPLCARQEVSTYFRASGDILGNDTLNFLRKRYSSVDEHFSYHYSYGLQALQKMGLLK